MLHATTIIKFLSFDAGAIKLIANNKMATWLGLLFVISAGFAREYDGEYLISEPWHLLIPVAASLIACFSMTLLVYGLAWCRSVRNVSFLVVFRSFLNLYWMTAPLAWPYAIPVERIFDPGEATAANLSLLALVAAWRVFLMVRCVQVLYGAHVVAAFFPVILFSDTIAMLAIWLVPGPIFMIMGGVRLTDSENLILSVRIWMILIGYGTFLIWLIGYFVLCARSNPWHFYNADPKFDDGSTSVSLGAWGLAAISILIWIPILPATQAEQRLRWNAERSIRSEDFASLSELTRQHAELEFPPHWDPPPRPSYGERTPSIYVVMAGLITNDGAQWMLDRYAEKVKNSSHLYSENLSRFSDEELSQFVDAISLLPDSHSIASRFEYQVGYELEDQVERGHSAQRIESLNRLLKLAPPPNENNDADNDETESTEDP